MYCIAVFQLKFGVFKKALQLRKNTMDQDLFPASKPRMLSNITGQAFRPVFETEDESLIDYETTLQGHM